MPANDEAKHTLDHVVRTGQRLLAFRERGSGDRTGCTVAGARSEVIHGDTSPVPAHVPSRTEEAMKAFASDLRRRGRHIGVFPCVVYAALRSVRVLILTASRPVDIVAAYAPALAETCAASTPSCIAIFCRCVI